MKKKILIVDENPDARGFMTFFLRSKGFDTFEAEDGLAAIAIAKSECPDLIFMDIKLPDMDGVDAIRIIRALEHFDNTPIVAITVFCGIWPDAVKAGYTHVLEKPVKFPHLMETVQTLLTPATI